MKPESLRTVIRLRKNLVDDASRHLAAAIHAETDATEAVRALAAEIARQRQAAEAMGADDADVEAFGVWFQRKRRRLDSLAAAQERAAIATARARAELTAVRAALEVVENLQADAHRAAAVEARRRDQILSDEAAGRPIREHPGREHPGRERPLD